MKTIIPCALAIALLTGCISGHYEGKKPDGTPVAFDGIIIFSPNTLKGQ